jgi:hypothetical protein
MFFLLSLFFLPPFPLLHRPARPDASSVRIARGFLAAIEWNFRKIAVDRRIFMLKEDRLSVKVFSVSSKFSK